MKIATTKESGHVAPGGNKSQCQVSAVRPTINKSDWLGGSVIGLIGRVTEAVALDLAGAAHQCRCANGGGGATASC